MREHVVSQMDKNKDRLISLEEFLQDNEATVDDNKDEGWKDLGQQQVYTDEELQKFEAEYAKQQGWGEHAYDPITPAPPHLAASQPVRVEPVGQVSILGAGFDSCYAVIRVLAFVCHSFSIRCRCLLLLLNI